MNKLCIMLVSLMCLSACDGAHEKAGETQDEAAANAAGVVYNGSGPAERMGEVQDRADKAAHEVRESSADALVAKAKNYERQADIDAERFEEQARSVRRAAEDRADALKREAAAMERQ